MPFTGTLPSNPTALRKMLVDLGLTPASSHPHALRQQLINHYDAHPEALNQRHVVPPAQTPPQPTAALARSYVNHAVNTATWRTEDRHNTPHVVPKQQRATGTLPSNPTNAPRTIEAVIEENRRLVETYQRNFQAALDYINSVWTPIICDGRYWISKNAVNHLPAWGFGGYIETNNPFVGVPLSQWEYDQASYTVNNYIGGTRNVYQSAIDAANRAAEAEISELLASQRQQQQPRHKSNLDNDYKNNVNSSKAIQRSVLKKIFSSSPIADLTFDPYTAILTHRTSKYAT